MAPVGRKGIAEGVLRMPDEEGLQHILQYIKLIEYILLFFYDRPRMASQLGADVECGLSWA